jgi:hypothetical protein
MNRFFLVASGVALSLLPSGAARAAPGESSFTPTSFVMPIYDIVLTDGHAANAGLYSCTPSTTGEPSSDAGATSSESDAGVTDAGASHDCGVDMADATALANLFSVPAYIAPGTYDSIMVMTCLPGQSEFVAKLQGSVELEGQTYYTTSGVPVISTHELDRGYTSITYAGCASTVKLAQPVTIGLGDQITISAFFTLQNLSWVLTNSSPGLGGCADTPGGEVNVCSGLPLLVGYVGSVAPSLDAFYITEDQTDLLATKAAGQVLVLSSGGEPFSGFLRRVYSHDSVDPSVSYDVPLREITRNSDASSAAGDAGSDASSSDAGALASYDVFSIGDPAEDVTKYRVRFPRFELRDHDGTLSTANGASQVDYRAVRR